MKNGYGIEMPDGNYPRYTKVEGVRKKLRLLKPGQSTKVRRSEFIDVSKYRNYVYHVADYDCTKYTANYNRKTDVLTITRVK